MNSDLTAVESRRTVTAFFDNREAAVESVEKLVRAGVPRDRVEMIAGSDSAGGDATTDSDGGFWDALKDFFLPDEDRQTYAEGLRRGGYVVTVQPEAGTYDQALDILDEEGTVDLDERVAAWKREGWAGYQERGYGHSARGTRATTDDEGVIPMVQEELRVGKREVSQGRVRVRSYVVETPVQAEVNLRSERVTIERRPVDRAVTGSDEVFRDRVIEAEERVEEAVVAKEARVKEELIVHKDVDQRVETVSDTVRRTEVEVEDERDGTRRRDVHE